MQHGKTKITIQPNFNGDLDIKWGEVETNVRGLGCWRMVRQWGSYPARIEFSRFSNAGAGETKPSPARDSATEHNAA